MSEPLEHYDGCYPVTGLKEFRLGASRLLLQGQGPFVSVTDVESGKFIARIKVFRRNNVHGFIQCYQQQKGKTVVFVWGGSSLRMINVLGETSDDLQVKCATLEHAAPDWIYDVCPAHSEDTATLAYLITGHNCVLSIDVKEEVNSKYTKAIKLRHLFAGVKSTLYSADIVALSSSHILIAAGTVFGEIIVWSCYIRHGSEGVSSSIHHFFTGHDGSIFGVSISDQLPLAKNGEEKLGRLLASCSDDRTIRIWDISNCSYSKFTDQPAYVTDGFDLRSTGFGSTAPASMLSGSESSVAKCWGHVSRIWGIYFLPIQSEHPTILNLVSRGEDATCQLWRLDLASTPSEGAMKLNLMNISTLSHHAGKHIWSLALSQGDEETKLIYTGGNDGAVLLSELTHVGKAEDNGADPSVKISPYSPKTLLKAAHSKTDSGSPAPRLFAFVSNISFVMTYASGLVQVGTVLSTTHTPVQSAAISKSQVLWEKLSVSEDLRACSCISALSRCGIAILSGSTNIVHLYNHSTKSLTQINQLPARPVRLFILDADFDTLKPHQNFRFLAAYPSLKIAELFDVTMKKSGITSISRTELVCPPPLEISTASTVCHGKCIVLGGKHGQLLFYRLDGEKERVESSLIHHRAHGRSHVSFISSIEDAENPNVGYALTGGRDGYYCVYRLCSQTDQPQSHSFQLIHRSAAPFPQVERAFLDSKTGHFMLLGFRGTRLILWDEITRTELLTLDCGGVHRSWEFMPQTPDMTGAGAVVWIQARSLHVLVTDSAIYRPLQLGSHGREIKTLAISRKKQAQNPLPTLIASGGEDTLIRLSTLSPRSRDSNCNSIWSSVRCLHSMSDHVAGLQQIKWSDDGRFLFSSSGKEEFFAWRIRSIPLLGITALVEAAVLREDFDSELRVTGFDVLRMQSIGDEKDCFLLALAYSNSTVKVFLYTSSTESHTFELLGRGTYSTNCLTEAYFLCSSDSSRISLVTGATDGYLAFWPLDFVRYKPSENVKYVTIDLSQPIVHPIQCETHHAVHTSSIKTLEVFEISPGLHILVSGGDDNSLSVTLLKQDTSIVRVVGSTSVSNAHTSAVTAVKILNAYSPSHHDHSADKCNDPTTTLLEIASSGNDQRVKVWSVAISHGSREGQWTVGISLRRNKYCPVADISSIDIMSTADTALLTIPPTADGSAMNRRVLVIGGVGISMFALDEKKGNLCDL